ncbi:MAG: hypothetical protein Q4Q53_07895, partial [Methanocorpusculum sp.]|nr:hypothetical protein [Methanocorpusculum sp.]
DEYSKALEICPQSAVIRCCRAELLLSEKKSSEALADFSKIISEASENENRYWISLSYLGRGLLRVERGEIEGAIMDFSFAEDLANKEGDKGLSARIAQELERSGI